MLTSKQIEEIDSFSFSFEKKIRKLILKRINKNVSFPQLAIIRYLYVNGKQNITHISQYMNSTLSAITSIVNNMNKLDLIERERSDEDRRVVFINLTENGRNVYKQHIKNKKEIFNMLLEYFNEDEVKAFHKIMKKIHNIVTELEEKEIDDYEK